MTGKAQGALERLYTVQQRRVMKGKNQISSYDMAAKVVGVAQDSVTIRCAESQCPAVVMWGTTRDSGVLVRTSSFCPRQRDWMGGT